MRYKLRTLVVVMLLGGPLCSWGWKVWQSGQLGAFVKAREAVAARWAEMKIAQALNDGSRRRMAGERHATLRLQRAEVDARERSVLYRVFEPAMR
jgi:hypothetical protein